MSATTSTLVYCVNGYNVTLVFDLLRSLNTYVDADIDKTTFDLSVKNPDGGEEIIHRSPFEIMDEIAALDAESADVLTKIRGLL